MLQNSQDYRLEFVGEMIKNWSRKHELKNDVAIINIGSDKYFGNGLAKTISGVSSIIFPTQETWSSLKTGKASFIVILSDEYNNVSLCNRFNFAQNISSMHYESSGL